MVLEHQERASSSLHAELIDAHWASKAESYSSKFPIQIPFILSTLLPTFTMVASTNAVVVINISHWRAAHAEVSKAPSKANITHETIANAASHEAAEAFNRHHEKEGKPPTEAEANELTTNAINAYVDREVDGKDLSHIDKALVKRTAAAQTSAELSVVPCC